MLSRYLSASSCRRSSRVVVSSPSLDSPSRPVRRRRRPPTTRVPVVASRARRRLARRSAADGRRVLGRPLPDRGRRSGAPCGVRPDRARGRRSGRPRVGGALAKRAAGACGGASAARFRARQGRRRRRANAGAASRACGRSSKRRPRVPRGCLRRVPRRPRRQDAAHASPSARARLARSAPVMMAVVVRRALIRPDTSKPAACCLAPPAVGGWRLEVRAITMDSPRHETVFRNKPETPMERAERT